MVVVSLTHQFCFTVALKARFPDVRQTALSRVSRIEHKSIRSREEQHTHAFTTIGSTDANHRGCTFTYDNTHGFHEIGTLVLQYGGIRRVTEITTFGSSLRGNLRSNQRGNSSAHRRSLDTVGLYAQSFMQRPGSTSYVCHRLTILKKGWGGGRHPVIRPAVTWVHLKRAVRVVGMPPPPWVVGPQRRVVG